MEHKSQPKFHTTFPQEEAKTHRCEQCGVATFLQLLKENFACPYCDHVQTLSADAQQELKSYHHQFEKELLRAAAELEAAAEAEYARRKANHSNQFGYRGIILMAIVVPSSILVYEKCKDRLTIEDEWGSTLAVWIPSTLFFLLLFITYSLIKKRHLRASMNQEPVGILVCPSCGGHETIVAGELLVQCNFCKGPLMPSVKSIQQGLLAAKHHYYRCQLRKQKEERLGHFESSRHLSHTLVWSMVPPIGLWNLLKYTRKMPLMARQRKKRKHIMQHLPCLFPNQVYTLYERPHVALEWLNAFWLDAYAECYFMETKYYWGCKAIQDGFSILIHGRFGKQPGDETALLYQSFCHVLIAAEIPGVSEIVSKNVDWPEHAINLYTILQELGFQAEIKVSGLYLSSLPSFVLNLEKDCAHIMYLQDVIPIAITLLAQLRAKPSIPYGLEKPFEIDH